MKKIYLFTVFLAFASYAFAQSIVVREAAKSKAPNLIVNSNNSKDITDTLFLEDYANNASANYNYLAPGYGYILGSNWDTMGVIGNTQVAQGYLNMSSIHIEELLVFVGAKGKHSGSGSSLIIYLNLIDSIRSYGPPPDYNQFEIDCPGTLLGSTTIPWNDLDTSAMLSVATFNPPISIEGTDFAAVFDVTNFYNNADTISIIGGEGVASSVSGFEYTWYLYPSTTPFWTQFSHVWTSGGNPIDAAIAAFPVYGDGPGGINEMDFINGIKLSQNQPNPAAKSTEILYEIQNSSDITFQIYDITGRLVVNQNEGKQLAGKHSIVIDSDKLHNGTYYYSLKTDNNRVTKKMVIAQ